jgi:hypothetical protein
LYDAFAGSAWQFLEKGGGTGIAGAGGLAGFTGRIARAGFVCPTFRHTRLGLCYSLASGGESVTIIRKSPDYLFFGSVSDTIMSQMDDLRFAPPFAGK